MNSMARDVAHFLVGKGSLGAFGGDLAWCLNYGVEPDKPDSAITIYDTGGMEPDTDELDLERPSFQVRVRSLAYDDAYAKHKEIKELLTLPLVSFNMTSCKIIGIQMTSDVLSLGRDDANRFLLVANFLAMRTSL